MRRYLIQFFSSRLDPVRKKRFYVAVGKEILLALQAANVLNARDIILPFAIQDRPEYGCHYARQGMFPHGVAIIETDAFPSSIKDILVGIEHWEAGGKIIRLMDIDLYQLDRGVERKVSAKGDPSLPGKTPLLSLIARAHQLRPGHLDAIKRKIYLAAKSNEEKHEPTAGTLTARDWQLAQKVFGADLVTLAGARRIPSRTNIVRYCTVECVTGRQHVYIKEFLPHPISNPAVELPPVKERMRRAVSGNQALLSALPEAGPLRATEILGLDPDLGLLMERDPSIPYSHESFDFQSSFTQPRQYRYIAQGLAVLHGSTLSRTDKYLSIPDPEKEIAFAAELIRFRILAIKNHPDSTLRFPDEPGPADFESELDRTLQVLRGNRGALSHGDLAPKNIIQTDENVFFLTDFEHVCYHDPAFEAGFFAGHILFALEVRSRTEADKRCRDFLACYLQQLRSVGVGEAEVGGIQQRSLLYAHLACQYRRASSRENRIQPGFLP